MRLTMLVLLLFLVSPVYLITAQSGLIEDIDLHTDGRMAVGYSGGMIQVFDGNGQLDYSLQLPEAVYTVDWNPIDDRLAVAAGGPIYIIDGSTGQIIHRLDGDGTFIVRWSPDGTEVATHASNGSRGVLGIATVSLDPEAEVPVRILETSAAHPITAIEWNPNGTKVATGYQNGDVVIWDTVSDQRLLSWNVNPDDFIAALAWSPDGSKLATASDFIEARVWNANTGIEIISFDAAVEDIAWSPDGSRVAGVRTNNVRVWDATTGQLIENLAVDGFVRTVTWSFDGTKLAYAESSEPKLIVAPLPPPTSDVGQRP